MNATTTLTIAQDSFDTAADFTFETGATLAALARRLVTCSSLTTVRFT